MGFQEEAGLNGVSEGGELERVEREKKEKIEMYVQLRENDSNAPISEKENAGLHSYFVIISPVLGKKHQYPMKPMGALMLKILIHT